MSDYTNYDCPCGRKHDVGIECAIGKRHRNHNERTKNMTAIERLESLMLEHEAGQQKVSMDKAHQLLLKIAKQMEEIERLKSGINALDEQNTELMERWNMVRALCGAEADDTVPEVFNRIKHAHNVVKAASDMGVRRTLDARAERL